MREASPTKRWIRPFTLFLRLYQTVLSPWLGPACRFYPSCSQYAMEALETHGVVAGLWLSLKRLCRCHPWGGHGIDMVPQNRQSLSQTLTPPPSTSVQPSCEHLEKL